MEWAICIRGEHCMIDLTSRVAIQSSFFVKITNGTNTLLFSDHFQSQTFDGSVYVPLGKLMAVTPTVSELRTSFRNLTVTVSGIPNASLQDILTSEYKGSVVELRRGVYDVATGALITGGTNPVIKFKGFVNNWSLNEDYNIVDRTSTNTIQFDCNSLIDILANKIAGRRTNSASMKRFYPTDVSFDRVAKLENTEFNFGKKRITGD